MKKLAILLAVILLALGLAASVSAQPEKVQPLLKTVYVDGTYGTDVSWCGQQSDTNACKTIQYAIDNKAIAGDTIRVAPGTYNEWLVINKNNLTIQSSAGAATTIIDVQEHANEGIGIHADGVILDGFTIQGATTNTTYEMRMVHVEGSNNVVKNNIVVGDLTVWGGDGVQYGVFIDGWDVAAEDNIIENNEVHDINYIGIEAVQQYASGNIIRDNDLHDIGFYAIAMDRSPGNTVTQNTISDLLGMPDYPAADWCWGIIVWGELADGNTITEQTVTNSPNGGIALSSAHNTTVSSCDISNNDKIGLMVAWSSWAGGIPAGNTVTGNRIMNNGQDGVLIKPGSGSIGADNVFHGNNIAGNTNYGMNNLSTLLIDAENNWWGHNSGPYHPTTNPSGQGDAVTDNVDYDPWLVVAAPQLLKPRAGAILVRHRVTFRWAPPDGAVEYRLQVWPSGDRAHKIVNQVLTGTEFTKKLPNGAYRWHVKAGYGAGLWGPWSETRGFRVMAP